MRHLSAGAALLLVAGLGSACGGGPPEDASEADFCRAYHSLTEDLADLAADASDARAVETMRAWGERLQESGTPEDIPEEARDGYELVVDTLEGLDEGTTQEELDQLGEDFSADEEKAGEAFATYVQETCPMELPEMPALPDVEGELGDLESEMDQQLEDLESELDPSGSP